MLLHMRHAVTSKLATPHGMDGMELRRFGTLRRNAPAVSVHLSALSLNLALPHAEGSIVGRPSEGAHSNMVKFGRARRQEWGGYPH